MRADVYVRMCGYILGMCWHLKGGQIKTERKKEDVGEGGVDTNMFTTVCVCVLGAFSDSHNEYMCFKGPPGRGSMGA